MSEPSHRYRQECIERERRRQHVSEPADWAGTALQVGYCLRRAEERQESADACTETQGVDEARVVAVAQALRTGEARRVSLLSPAVMVAALDRIIATELDKRREHLREQLDDDAWAELEDYIAWWVVHGYALRASERPRL